MNVHPLFTQLSAESRQTLARALALSEAGRGAEAAAAFAQAQAHHPGDAALPLLAGYFFQRVRQPAEALAAARRAVQLAPSQAQAHTLLGCCLLDTGDPASAAQALRDALALDPKQAMAHNALGLLAELDGRYDDAELHWADAIEAGSDDTAPLCNLARLLRDTGRADEATALLGPAADALPADIGLQRAAAVNANYAPQMDAEAVAAQHRRHGQAVRAAMPAAASQPLPRWPRHGALRVGLLSPDFREHSVAWFLLPLLQHLDPARVQVQAYLCGRRADALTSRFRALVPGFHDVAAMDDLALARRVRADRLDVLVECAGLFEGARPAALALRMAPLQVTWLGYPNTTGLPNVDVRLVDALTDPPGTDALASERLLRMAAPFLCWQPDTDLPLPVRSTARPVTFGCFNHLAKLHDGLLALWARVLQAVPGSRLLLKAGPLADPAVAAALRERCAAAGIAPDRLELRGHVPQRRAHLAAYGEVDIALDTFPYHGTTTTCEALWMGTPVVTRAGRGHPSRVGLSLLHAAGLQDWVTDSDDAYVACAARLAADRDALARHHATLRSRLEASPLCDGAGFARRFTAALESL